MLLKAVPVCRTSFLLGQSRVLVVLEENALLSPMPVRSPKPTPKP